MRVSVILVVSYQQLTYHYDGEEGCEGSRERKTEGSKEGDEIGRCWSRALLLHQLGPTAVVVTKLVVGGVVTDTVNIINHDYDYCKQLKLQL